MDKVHISSKTYDIPTPKSIFQTYQALRGLWSEQDLFLLESLSGSEKDRTRSVMGYKPLLTLAWNGQKLQLSGQRRLIEAVMSLPLCQAQQRQGDAVCFDQPPSVFDLLRQIESVFVVEAQRPEALFGCGFFGYIGYDAIFDIEAIPKKIVRQSDEHTVCLTLFEGIIHINLLNQHTTLTINEVEGEAAVPVQTVTALLTASDSVADSAAEVIQPTHYTSIQTVDKQTYFQWVDKAKYHISVGDVYQIQFGYDVNIQSDRAPFDTYRRLRQFNPSPYMYYYCGVDDVRVVGASPEMFAILDASGKVQMRPIAGTARKTEEPSQTERLKQQLLSDEKERAEHLMLVDLCRNDIARICTAESLSVDELMVIEEYSHVIHIVSHVSGQLKPQLDKYDLVAATFPAGTMTGTPKIRAVEIIEDTEVSARGVYAGCIGFFGFNNTLVTALCIRTAVWQNGVYTIRASAGIVEDSTPQQEWAETISKLSSTYFAITDKELSHEDFID
ncbi:anthranilate synthase component I family protein [Neisseriaceae bacterium ESL0693]|nr:anthranilate synthase component I family protein [Neisseriaceae bacterium ESL0693]